LKDISTTISSLWKKCNIKYIENNKLKKINMETKTLNQLRDKIHANSVKHGFYDDEANAFAKACNLDIDAETLKHAFFAQKIALIHSELSEALEANRVGKKADMVSLNNAVFELLEENSYGDTEFATLFQTHIKDTVEDELADAIIRILDLCGSTRIDIERHIELKMRYNELREYKHGKKY
jgi:NTP pyrophosphatase (non-canonical NTP hydrolase)